LCIAENIIHPRLPVIGVEALSHCIASSGSQADANGADTEPSLFGTCRPGLGHYIDVELSQNSSADVVVHASSVSEPSSTVAAPSTAPVSEVEMESIHTKEHAGINADDSACSPDEESLVEGSVTRNVDSQNVMTFPESGQELDKSESLSFVLAVSSSFAVTTNSPTLSATVRKDDAADETVEAPTSLPDFASADAQCSGSSAVVEDKLPECLQSELQQSVRKRKYSSASSVNDGDDSESEGGEIEV